MSYSSNSSLVESIDSLNARYAEALLPLVCVFGIFIFAGVLGNTVVLIVFSRSREYKTNYKVYVLFHGVIDLVTCMTVIPGEIFNLRNYFVYKNETACKAICFMNISGASASALMLMLISVERFMRVKRPLGTQISPRMAVRLCWICIFVALLLAYPTVLICGIEETTITNIHGGNTTAYLCIAEEKFSRSVWRKVYKQSLLILTLFVFVTSILMYVSIWRTVYAATRTLIGQDSFKMRGKRANTNLYSLKEKSIKGKNAVEDFKVALTEGNPNTTSSCVISRTDSGNLRNGSSQRTDSDGIGPFPYKTLIWFVLTVTFIATRILYCALSLAQYKILYFQPPLFTLASFFGRLYFINSVINPLVYALLDFRFRCSCRRIFLKMICV